MVQPGIFFWLLARSWLLGMVLTFKMVGRKMHKVGIPCKESKMDKSLTQATVQSGILTHRLGQSDLPQLGGGMCFRAGASWIRILCLFLR